MDVIATLYPIIGKDCENRWGSYNIAAKLSYIRNYVM